MLYTRIIDTLADLGYWDREVQLCQDNVQRWHIARCPLIKGPQLTFTCWPGEAGRLLGTSLLCGCMSVDHFTQNPADLDVLDHQAVAWLVKTPAGGPQVDNPAAGKAVGSDFMGVLAGVANHYVAAPCVEETNIRAAVEKHKRSLECWISNALLDPRRTQRGVELHEMSAHYLQQNTLWAAQAKCVYQTHKVPVESYWVKYSTYRGRVREKHAHPEYTKSASKTMLGAAIDHVFVYGPGSTNILLLIPANIIWATSLEHEIVLTDNNYSHKDIQETWQLLVQHHPNIGSWKRPEASKGAQKHNLRLGEDILNALKATRL